MAIFEHPLITAIMPTRARPEMAQRALNSFMSQTWRNKELVILDEATEPSFSRAPAGTVYSRIQQPQTVGRKRNLAVSRARGEIICHFDDDDWSAPERMEEQVERLLTTDYLITGYNGMFFTDGRDWWKYTAPRWYALGTSLMYRIAAWRERPFSDEQIGEDTSFIRNRRVLSVDAEDRMVAWIHNANTSEKRDPIKKAPQQWKYLGEVA